MAGRDVVVLNEDKPQLEVPQPGDWFNMKKGLVVNDSVVITKKVAIGSSVLSTELSVKGVTDCVVKSEGGGGAGAFKAVGSGESISHISFENITNGVQARIEGVDGGGLRVKTGTGFVENIEITSTGFTRVSEDGVFSFVNAGHGFQTAANKTGLWNYCNNTSFTSRVQVLSAMRAASATYSFLECWGSLETSFEMEFNLRGDGNAFCDGAWSGGGADYAEYFEWLDGNPDDDRRGFSVVLDGTKIRIAEAGDDPIGVISGRPAVIGDADVGRWKGKYLRDDFGAYIFEPYTVTEWKSREIKEESRVENIPAVLDDKGRVVAEARTVEIPATYKTVKHSFESDKIPNDVVVPVGASVLFADGKNNLFKRRKLNPVWDEVQPYVAREDRAEWDAVGLMGKLRVRKGQVVGSRWVKMRDISDVVEEWLVR